MEAETYAEEIGLQLIRLQRLRDRTLAQISSFARDDLELSSYNCLLQIMCSGPMRSGELAEALLSDPSTVSRQVAHLVERGLIERQADPSDGRASVLAVTDIGRAKAEQVRRRRTENLGRVIVDWAAQDRKDFVRLLDKFIDGYEKCRPEMLAAIRERLGAPDSEGHEGDS